ncbi:SIMPL domain-containing protein [Candidatus Entotheonella palauensis]|uniref:SIMPL domain-containing protein n=1 Tax=Candidatus Entotheonella palauensis TaxID=93172 RepID=UPI000B7D03D1|nr:SIMPL domain-containing protein [Candidatus Entotheonella palauensis]
MYRYSWTICLLLCLSASSLWANAIPSQTVTTNGYGAVKVRPDVVFIRLFTKGSGLLPSDALTESLARMEKLQTALKAQHSEITDIAAKTLALSSGDSPMMERQSSPVAIHVLTITLPLKATDPHVILDTAVRAGALLSPPEPMWRFQNFSDAVVYGLQNHKSALSQANALALEDARSQAHRLVEASGLRLGAPVSLQTETLHNRDISRFIWGHRQMEQTRLFYPVKYFSSSSEEVSVYANLTASFALEQP